MVRSNFWITPKDFFASDLHLLHVLQKGLKEIGIHYFQEKVPLLHTASDQSNVFGMHTLYRGHHTFLFSPTSPRPTTVNILRIALHVNYTIFLKITLLLIDENVCRRCRQESPPKSRSWKSRIINWVQCDKCGWWYHV